MVVANCLRVRVVVTGRALCGPVGVRRLAVGNEVLGVDELMVSRVSCHPSDEGLTRAGDPRAHPIGPGRVLVCVGLDAVEVDPQSTVRSWAMSCGPPVMQLVFESPA